VDQPPQQDDGLGTGGQEEALASCHDVAKYILGKRGPITAMKLQKLLYYSQAWSLVWEEAHLFPEPIEAWANGPVVREAYEMHRGQFLVTEWPLGDAEKLSPDQKETVDLVLDFYGKQSAQYLSDLTHAEDPWKLARKGVQDGDRGDAEITHALMAEYYGSL